MNEGSPSSAFATNYQIHQLPIMFLSSQRLSTEMLYFHYNFWYFRNVLAQEVVVLIPGVIFWSHNSPQIEKKMTRKSNLTQEHPIEITKHP